MIVKQDRKRCIGCGYCADFSPSFWEMNNTDGKADFLNSHLKGNIYNYKPLSFEEEEFRKTAELCPVKVIIIE